VSPFVLMNFLQNFSDEAAGCTTDGLWFYSQQSLEIFIFSKVPI